jgi:type 2 lantibiotic biosynthesis protein LanM
MGFPSGFSCAMKISIQDPQWWQALTLQERLGLLRGYKPNGYLDSEPPTSPASRQIAEWRSQSPFQIESWFSRRLQLLGIDERQFAGLLGQPAHVLQEISPEPPPWLTFLFHSFSGNQYSLDPEPTVGIYFFPIFAPVIRLAVEKGKEKFRELAKNFAHIPFETAQIDGFLSLGLASYLDWIVGRAAVLELKVASLENRLEGSTPEARFQSFVRTMSQPEAGLEFFKAYPVLARILVETTSQWVESRIEFLGRLCQDWDLISTTFQIETKDSLKKISGGLGDRHSGGRSVLLASFSSGQKLIYKPRSLSIDQAFTSFLSWLTSRGAPPFRTPEVLPRGPYGWSEFIAAAPCEGGDQVEQFYWRQGGLLAVLHALEANDFHRENLVAQGEHPVLIDLESLCRADFGLGDIETYSSVAAFELTTSVLQVGLLPQPKKGKDGEAIDFSGIGGRAGQRWHLETPAWENAGTDAMNLVRRRQEIACAQNQPTLNGEPADPLEFSEQILGGFEAMYRLLLNHRDEFLAEESPLKHFAAAEVRAIFRVTQFYAIVFNESLHPDFLRNALDRDRLFDRIWFALERNPLAEVALKIIPSEQKDLWNGDIPCFRNSVDSLDAKSGQGELIPEIFTRSGLDAVRARFAHLGEEDLARQKLIIRSSLTAFEIGIEGGMAQYRQQRDARKATIPRLRREACAIGEHLIRSACCKDDYASWNGLSIAGKHWVLCPLSVDLYSGLPGIALFLAYLGSVERRNIYTDYARKTLAAIRRQLKKVFHQPKQIGGFEGWGGLIYVWTQLAVLWDDQELIKEAEDWLETIAPLVDVDRNFDIVSGSAGGILSLLKLWHITGSDRALPLAVKMGNRLLDQAQLAAEGIGWIVPTDLEGPLSGFSHGASGIAFSLSELSLATGDLRFLEAARRAIAFESSVFSDRAQNWLDLRGNRDPGSPREKFMTAWCHGAAGIGLSRLRILRSFHDEQIHQDLAAALRSTSTTGFGSNHSLCHGDLGNLELFLETSRTLGDLSCHREVELRTAQIVASIEDGGWLCGVPRGVETPGLMNGLAGIGYGFLRLIAPDEVPSVLLLE